jgi:hypothetical protein
MNDLRLVALLPRASKATEKEAKSHYFSYTNGSSKARNERFKNHPFVYRWLPVLNRKLTFDEINESCSNFQDKFKSGQGSHITCPPGHLPYAKINLLLQNLSPPIEDRG